MAVDCTPANCSLGDTDCGNRRFQNFQTRITIRNSPNMGYGVYAVNALSKGSIVVEYLGETIPLNVYMGRRELAESQGKKLRYVMKVNESTFIDSEFMGNYSRYINHCCQANMDIVKRTINNELHIFYVTNRDIKMMEELTVMYDSVAKLSFACQCPFCPVND